MRKRVKRANKVAWALPASFLSQVLYKVAVRSMRDFSSAKQVCRDWCDAGGGEEFETKLAKERIDTTEFEETDTFFDRYPRMDWSCYWCDSPRTPFDVEKDYAFRPLLVGTAAGFVTIPGAQLLEGIVPLRTVGVVGQLLDLWNKLTDAQASIFSESTVSSGIDSELSPIVLPWEPEKPITPTNVLKLLGAHPELLDEDCIGHMIEFENGFANSISLFFNLWDIVPIRKPKNPPRNPIADDFENFLMEAGPPCIFNTGFKKMNPMPAFYLRRLSDSLIGGFCACLFYT